MINILIIDDDNDDSDFLRDAIQQISSQTNCTMVSSSDEALKGMQTKKIPRPDLIFLDLTMPHINGIQCLRELKTNASVSEIPVAIYTTSKLYGDNVKSLKLGTCHFITKPSNFRYLCQMIIRQIFTKELIHGD
jgi:DNA-binding response OmpR family regulator